MASPKNRNPVKDSIALEQINLVEPTLKHSQTEAAYDPDKYPANLTLAKKHGKANKVYISKQEDKYEEVGREVCICCGNPVEAEEIPLNAGLDKLYHLGSGFALYFKFIKYSIGMLLVLLATSGLYNLITNVITGDCASQDDTAGRICLKGYILSFTIPNKSDKPVLLTVQLALNLASVIVILIYFHFLRFQFRKTEIEADDKTVTPGDYTIVIQGIPAEAEQKEIRKWLESFATPEMPIEIERIIRPYDITKYIEITKKLSTLTTQRDALKKRKNLNQSQKEKLTNLDAKVREQKDRLNDLKKPGVLKHCPIIYVTFKTSHQSNYIQNKFSKPFLIRLFGDVMSLFINTASHFQGHKVEVKRAPEPSDILWENLGFSETSRMKSRILTTFVTAFIIALSFAIIILVNWAQDIAENKYGPKSASVQGLSIVVSLIIMITNAIITMTIDFLAKFEKHLTFTYYLKGVAEKLSVAQFMNTALTSLFAELILSNNTTPGGRLESINFYNKGGLLEGIFWVFITSAFLAPILTIVDPAYLMKRFRRYQVEKQGENLNMYQKDANALYEGPTLAMPARYAAMIKIVFLTTFYAPAIPFAIIFTILGLVLCYWAEKYTLLRRNTLPKSIDDGLCDAMVEILEWSALAFSVGNIIYVKTLKNSLGGYAFPTESSVLIWITLGVSLVHIFFPMELLNHKLFPIKDEVTENQTYEQVRLDFITDYDRENPLTKAKALKEFMNRVKGIKNQSCCHSPSSPNKNAAFRKGLESGVVRRNSEREEVRDDSAKTAPQPQQEAEIDFDFLDDYAKQAQDQKNKLNDMKREEQTKPVGKFFETIALKSPQNPVLIKNLFGQTEDEFAKSEAAQPLKRENSSSQEYIHSYTKSPEEEEKLNKQNSLKNKNESLADIEKGDGVHLGVISPSSVKNGNKHSKMETSGNIASRECIEGISPDIRHNIVNKAF